MNSIVVLQLRHSIAILQEIQQHEENPDKYEVYQKNIRKLEDQLSELLPVPAHSLRDGSRTPTGPLRGGYAVLEPALSR